MYFRKKKNRSGVVSVQIIDKSSGKYRMIKTIGSSSDANEITQLVEQAQAWIKEQQKQYYFEFERPNAE